MIVEITNPQFWIGFTDMTLHYTSSSFENKTHIIEVLYEIGSKLSMVASRILPDLRFS